MYKKALYGQKSEKTGERSNILFQYVLTRNGDNAVKFRGDYRGYLVCDRYDGYNKMTNVTRCGCIAHVRRKFVEALPTDKEPLPTSKAAVGINYCNRLIASAVAAGSKLKIFT